jgi:hypothetical protein
MTEAAKRILKGDLFGENLCGNDFTRSLPQVNRRARKQQGITAKPQSSKKLLLAI